MQQVKTNYTTGFLGVNLGGVGMIFFLITLNLVHQLAISMLISRYLLNVTMVTSVCPCSFCANLSGLHHLDLYS